MYIEKKYYEHSQTYASGRNARFEHFIHRPSQIAPWALFDWYAIDQGGCVGIFRSPSPSPVPQEFFALSLDDYQKIHDYFGKIEFNCDAKLDVYKNNLAATGNFYYDAFEDRTGNCERWIVPPNPIHYTDLPGDIACIISRTKYRGLFSDSEVINIRESWEKWYEIIRAPSGSEEERFKETGEWPSV